MEDTMRKEEFLRQLEQLLSGISEEERADAMAYYRSYFEDAGDENEASILEELESPEKVAQSILKDLGIVAESGGTARSSYKSGSSWQSGKNSQGGYGSSQNSYGSSQNGYGSSQNSYGSSQNGYGSGQSSYGSGQSGYGSSQNGYGGTNGQDNYGYSSYGNYEEQNRKKNREIGIVVAVIALVVLSPIWLAVLGTLFGLVVGIIGALFGIVVAAVAVMGSLLFAGFLLLVIGFGALFSGSVAGGIGVIGIGFILLSFGILAVILTVWLLGTIVPWAWKGITDCFGKMWNKGREKKRL